MVENPSDPIGFAERVYAVVDAIPFGRVTTYGLIARALGAPRSARIVGGALLHTPNDRVHQLPAHRVVNRIGFLSGGWHFGHPDIMRDRLLAEGVPFKDEYTVDLRQVLWDPADEDDLDRLYLHDAGDTPDVPDDDLDGDAPFRVVR